MATADPGGVAGGVRRTDCILNVLTPRAAEPTPQGGNPGSSSGHRLWSRKTPNLDPASASLWLCDLGEVTAPF